MFVLGTHNNLLIKTVLLSPHNKLFDSEMRKQYILTHIWSLCTSKSKYDHDVSQVFQFGHNMSNIYMVESLKYLRHYSFIGFYSLDKKILLSVSHRIFLHSLATALHLEPVHMVSLQRNLIPNSLWKQTIPLFI